MNSQTVTITKSSENMSNFTKNLLMSKEKEIDNLRT